MVVMTLKTALEPWPIRSKSWMRGKCGSYLYFAVQFNNMHCRIAWRCNENSVCGYTCF